MSITEFLLARIAEDEAVAVAAEPHEEWISVGKIEDGGMDTADGEHVARWSPARALAECEAKRRIVEAWQKLDRDDTTGFVYGGGWDPGIGYASDALAIAMAHLATVYADHPDFDPTWSLTRD